MSERRPMRPDDEANRALLANVRPADWANPTPSGIYNLVVIGAGAAGLVTTAAAAALGAKVAIIERDRMGGDCLNVGCVPSKALLRSARAWADVRDAGRFGVRVPAGTTVDLAAVMERLRRLRAEMSPIDSAQRFRDLGADVYLGSARFTGPDTVEVDGRTLRFRRAVIATGSRPRRPDIPGLDEVDFLTNETVFELTELPRRLAMLGAGPLGCELAQAFARFGSEVTLIDTAARIMPRADAEAAVLVAAELVRDGIQLLLSTKVVGVARVDGTMVIHHGAGEVRCDQLLVGVGRSPNVEGLGLDTAGVRHDPEKGVLVDDHLRTSNPRIHAAGDICSSYQYTHAADALARIAVRNSLFLGRARASALLIPSCIYTDPEVAQVGLTEEEARRRGTAIRVLTQRFDHVDRAILDGETAGLVKVVLPAGGDELLGVVIVARHAGEMISEATLAMANGLGLTAVGRTIHPYPTQAEALRKVADQLARGRLKPWLVQVLRRYFAWGR